jgi:ATP-dependent Clp protease ATP-binding subunit ClpC
VFERFTDPARQVVVLAQEEARALQHNYIGTEHLLLGLLREERGLAARVLTSVGVTLELAREKVRAIVGQGDDVAPTGQIPFTPRAKKVMELGLREAQAMNHDFIGTEHLLLGLAREGEGVAMRIAAELGTGAESIRRETLRALGGIQPSVMTFGGGPTAFSPPRVHLRGPSPAQLVTAWVLGAATLGAGILVGWAIWG